MVGMVMAFSLEDINKEVERLRQNLGRDSIGYLSPRWLKVGCSGLRTSTGARRSWTFVISSGVTLSSGNGLWSVPRGVVPSSRGVCS